MLRTRNAILLNGLSEGLIHNSLQQNRSSQPVIILRGQTLVCRERPSCICTAVTYGTPRLQFSKSFIVAQSVPQSVQYYSKPRHNFRPITKQRSLFKISSNMPKAARGWPQVGGSEGCKIAETSALA
jgi:hypothetical protein